MKVFVNSRNWYEILGKINKKSKMIFLYDKNIQNCDLINKNKSILLSITEKKKNTELLEKLFSDLNELSVDRETTLVAVGGSIVNDVVGFVASSFMGGLDWIYIPVDFASIAEPFMGGRLNTEHGKNLFQTIYPPKNIILDHNFIMAEKNKGILYGLFPMIRASASYNSALFNKLEKRWMDVFLRKEDIIKEFILPILESSASNSTIYDFGFLISNALEWSSKYQINHGIAVAFGMEIELRAARISGYIDKIVYDRILNLLNSVYDYFRYINVYRKKMIDIQFSSLTSYLSPFIFNDKGLMIRIPVKIGKMSQKQLFIPLTVMEKAFMEFIGKINNDLSSNK